MDENEMWRKCDVGSYHESMGLFYFYLGAIIDSQEPQRISNYAIKAREIADGLRTRYEMIPFSELDNDKVPLELMLQVRERIPKVAQTFSQIAENPNNGLAGLVDSGFKIVTELKILGNDFRMDPRYRKYGDSIKDNPNIRIKASSFYNQSSSVQN